MMLYIKYMVSNRCKMLVKEALTDLGLHFILVELGVVEIMETLSPTQLQSLNAVLTEAGLEIMDDKKAKLVERIKNVVIEMVHHSKEIPKTNFSDYISDKLSHDYTYLANLFSETQGSTIEYFIIAHKTERIKELIIYDEMNITEIAFKMNYSSVAHLSSQFKKVTGLSPTRFKQLKERKRNPIEEI
jgi:AraC-like DNA-binding protein